MLLIVLLWMLVQPRAWASERDSSEVNMMRRYFLGISAHGMLGLPEDKSQAAKGLEYLSDVQDDVKDYLNSIEQEHDGSLSYTHIDIEVLSALMALQTDEAVKRISHLWSTLFSEDFSEDALKSLRVNYPEDIYQWREEHFESFKRLAHDHLCSSDGTRALSHFCLYAIKLLRFITTDKDNRFSQDAIRRNSRLAPNVAHFFRTPHLGLLAAPYLTKLFNNEAAGLPMDAKILKAEKLSMVGIWQQWLSSNNSGTYNDLSFHAIPPTDNNSGLSKETLDSLKTALRRPRDENTSGDGLVGLLLQKVTDMEDYLESIWRTVNEITHEPGKPIKEQLNTIIEFLKHDKNLTLASLIKKLDWKEVVSYDLPTVVAAINSRIEEAEKKNTELIHKLKDRTSQLESTNEILQSYYTQLQVKDASSTSQLERVTKSYEGCLRENKLLTQQNREMHEQHARATEALEDDCKVKLSRAREREKELVSIVSEAVDSLVEAPKSGIKGDKDVSLGLLENKYRSGDKEVLVRYLSALTQDVSQLARHRCDKDWERKTSAMLSQHKSELEGQQKECLRLLQIYQDEHELIATTLREARPNLGSKDLKDGLKTLIKQCNTELHELQDLENRYETLSYKYQAIKEENLKLSQAALSAAEEDSTSLLDELREVGANISHDLEYQDPYGMHTSVGENPVGLEVGERLQKCLDEVQQMEGLRRELDKARVDCASRLDEVRAEVTNTHQSTLEKALELVEHEEFHGESLKSALQRSDQNNFVELLDDLVGKVVKSMLKSRHEELQKELERQRSDLKAEMRARLMTYGSFRRLGKVYGVNSVIASPKLGGVARDAALFVEVLHIFGKGDDEGPKLIGEMQHLRESIGDGEKPLLEAIDRLQGESASKAELDRRFMELQQQKQALLHSYFRRYLPVSSCRETLAPRALLILPKDPLISPLEHHQPHDLNDQQGPGEEAKVFPPPSEPTLEAQETVKEPALLHELHKLRRAYNAALSLIWFHPPLFRTALIPPTSLPNIVQVPMIKWKDRIPPRVNNRAWQLGTMLAKIEPPRIGQLSYSYNYHVEETNTTVSSRNKPQPPSRVKLPFNFSHIRRLCPALVYNPLPHVSLPRDWLTETNRVSLTNSPRPLGRAPLVIPSVRLPPSGKMATLSTGVGRPSSGNSGQASSPQLVTNIGDEIEGRVDKRYLPRPAHSSSTGHGIVAKAATPSRDSPCTETIKAWQQMNSLSGEEDNKPTTILDEVCLANLSPFDISAATNLQLAHIEARHWPAHLLRAISPAMMAYVRFDHWQPDQTMCSVLSIGQLSMLKTHPRPYATFKLVCRR